jgi:hypothetical protein
MVLCGALAAATLAFAGCSPTGQRAGVGFAPALIYKDYTSPVGGARGGGGRGPGGPPPPPIPRSQLVSHKVIAHQVGLNIPFLGPPGLGRALSVGWGNASLETAFETGGLSEVSFADAREFSILGIYDRMEITVYGPPKGS